MTFADHAGARTPAKTLRMTGFARGAPAHHRPPVVPVVPGLPPPHLRCSSIDTTYHYAQLRAARTTHILHLPRSTGMPYARTYHHPHYHPHIAHHTCAALLHRPTARCWRLPTHAAAPDWWLTVGVVMPPLLTLLPVLL